MINPDQILLPAVYDTEEEFQIALKNYEESKKAVSKVFDETVSNVTPKSSENTSFVVTKCKDILGINIQCFGREYVLRYEAIGSLAEKQGLLVLCEKKDGELVKRQTTKIDAWRFESFIKDRQQPVAFDSEGLIHVVHYWLSQPLPNLKELPSMDYGSIV